MVDSLFEQFIKEHGFHENRVTRNQTEIYGKIIMNTLLDNNYRDGHVHMYMGRGHCYSGRGLPSG